MKEIRMGRKCRRSPWPPFAVSMLLTVLLLSSPAAAQDVGRFSIVTNQVTSLKPGAKEPVPASVGSLIVLDEQERTGESSAAQMMFGEGATISIGAATAFSVTRQAVEEATGAGASSIDLLLGRIRVFVSRFWTGRSEVQVSTPTAVVGIKGSEAVIEVLEDGTTRVTFLRGSGRVRPRRGGAWRDIAGGQQLVIRPETGEMPLPGAIGPGQEEDLVAKTRPIPDVARDNPQGRPGGRYTATGFAIAGSSKGKAIQTNAPASGGPTFANPAYVGVFPDTPLPQSRQGVKGQLVP